MNSAPYQPPDHLSITLKSCHPERSLAESEANRQTQSKDPYELVLRLAMRGVFPCAERQWDHTQR